MHPHDTRSSRISKYVAIIRYSVRKINSEKDDLLCGLTQEGETAVLKVGKALNPAEPICLYSSFVGRSRAQTGFAYADIRCYPYEVPDK